MDPEFDIIHFYVVIGWFYSVYILVLLKDLLSIFYFLQIKMKIKFLYLKLNLNKNLKKRKRNGPMKHQKAGFSFQTKMVWSLFNTTVSFYVQAHAMIQHCWRFLWVFTSYLNVSLFFQLSNSFYSKKLFETTSWRCARIQDHLQS